MHVTVVAYYSKWRLRYRAEIPLPAQAPHEGAIFSKGNASDEGIIDIQWR